MESRYINFSLDKEDELTLFLSMIDKPVDSENEDGGNWCKKIPKRFADVNDAEQTGENSKMVYIQTFLQL